MAQLFEKALVILLSTLIASGFLLFMMNHERRLTEYARYTICDEVATRLVDSAYRAWMLNRKIEFYISCYIPITLEIIDSRLYVSSGNYTTLRNLPIPSQPTYLEASGVVRGEVRYSNGVLKWRWLSS
jgi:hypothetical protein